MTPLMSSRRMGRRRSGMPRNHHGFQACGTLTLLVLTLCAVSNCQLLFGVESLAFGFGGGRTPGQPNMPSLEDMGQKWEPKPAKPWEARLTIIQVTDVYSLEHFASLKTLIKETKETCGSENVVSMLTGDFLAPYLLSSVDKGQGMMNAISRTPIDYLTWGNHEADIDHRTVCKHVKRFPGTWLNSNMQDHEAMEYQKPFDVVEVRSADGTNVRRIGLVAVLSNDPALYSHFKAPGAFGGAHIDDPWETLRKYKKLLEGPEYQCDVVVPLQHTYVPDDYRTCREFDFPVVLSGHDHHRVDEVVEGTRLLKPGLDAIYATALELSWKGSDAPARPEVHGRFVECAQWEPDPILEKQNAVAYNVLAPLRNTELARVPPTFEPLSSCNSRGVVCTMGKFVCSLLLSSLNTSRRQRQHRVDAVMLMGGNIRGGKDYPLGSFFSLEALEAEIKSDETIGNVPMPGYLLAEGVAATHAGDPIPGWMQYDAGVKEEFPADGSTPIVTHVGGKPLEPDRIYRVATKIQDLTNGQSPPWTEYYTKHPELLPPKGAYVNVHAELMGYFARNLWRKIWEAIAPIDLHTTDSGSDEPCDIVDCDPSGRLSTLDLNDDGIVTVDDIHGALRDLIGLSVDDEEKSLATFVHEFADTTGDGQLTLKDFENFCNDIMPDLYANQQWRLSFPRAPQPNDNVLQQA